MVLKIVSRMIREIYSSPWLILLVLLGLLGCEASNHVQKSEKGSLNSVIKYAVSNVDIVNPGRGFYYPYATKSSDFESLKLDDALNLRNNFTTPTDGNYEVKHSILLRQYILDSFVTDETISSEFLQQLQGDFDIARQAGVKIIVRFSYNNVPPTGNCGAWICPPYGDASKKIVLAHIEQVSKVLSHNHDVLLTWQAGFIGTWGEMMFTDHFGDFDAQGTIYDENWRDRIEVVKAILDSVPKDIPVQVRKPQLIQKFVHGVDAAITSAALSKEEAFDGSDASRIGLYNDCFLATEDDWGTYADYGTSSKAPINNENVVQTLKEHQAQNSLYTLVGGETCHDDDYSPQNDCSGGVVGTIDRFNFTYLNSAYNNKVNNDWQDENCMADIKLRLGYRLSMLEARLPDSATIGQTVPFYLDIENLGFTSPMFPMELRVVFTHKLSGETFYVALDRSRFDVRQWRPEQHIIIEENLQLPSKVKAGEYTMSLHVADISNNGIIANRPEYSIQFANKNTWDDVAGYNSLLHNIILTE
ncbi:MAG: DUF4832 domain-containing protein [Paraglaciecola sp.]|uniref:DUF4832 domain-containing protein n=1 Tax=Paraglaciecola sp. TaxID=1920173 RepID=UPI0032970458